MIYIIDFIFPSRFIRNVIIQYRVVRNSTGNFRIVSKSHQIPSYFLKSILRQSNITWNMTINAKLFQILWSDVYFCSQRLEQTDHIFVFEVLFFIMWYLEHPDDIIHDLWATKLVFLLGIKSIWTISSFSFQKFMNSLHESFTSKLYEEIQIAWEHVNIFPPPIKNFLCNPIAQRFYESCFRRFTWVCFY